MQKSFSVFTALLLTLVWVTNACAQANTDVVINEVFYGGNASQDWVELKNTGVGSINVSTFWFCSRFGYRQVGLQSILVGDDYLLQPGELLVVAAGQDLNQSLGADLALYQLNTFSDANQMLDFVQWTTDQRVGRSNEARMRGVWTSGMPTPVDFVPAALAGESVSFCGVNSGGGLLTLSTDFVNGTPSMGEENDLTCLNAQEIILLDSFESLL